MSWLNRRKAKLQEVASQGATPVVTSIGDPLPPDVRDAVEKALAPYPYRDVAKARFFGVPMDMFTKEELIRIVSWVGMNARDHRHDS